MAMSSSNALFMPLARVLFTAVSGGGKQELPPMPQAPNVEDAKAKAAAMTKQKRLAMARNQSVFTSPLGVADQATTARKTLLGE